MDLDPSVVWDFAGTLVGTLRERPRQLPATVSRVDPDGTVWLSMPGADGLVPASTTADVGADDAVTVEWWGNAYHVTGNRTSPSVGTRAAAALRRATAAAAKVAGEAKGIADAVGQHFWSDDNGVHVSNEDGNATGERNILMNSLGILLRQGSAWLASFSDSAVAFYDGLGNEAANIVAQFGADGATVGYADEAHTSIGADYFRMEDASGTPIIEVTTENGPDGLADANITFVNTYSTAPFLVGSAHDIAEIVGLYEVLSGGTYGDLIEVPTFAFPDNYKVLKISTVLTVGKTYTVKCRTLDTLFTATLGTRATEANGWSYPTGDGSVVLGRDSIASAIASIAAGEHVVSNFNAQAALGRYNAIDGNGDYVLIIGNGTADDARSNAFAVGWDGTLHTAKDTDTTTVADVLTAETGVTIGAVSYVQRGSVAALFIRASRSAATSGATTIGTLVTGKRPVMETAAPAPSGSGDVYVAADGTITYRPSGSVSANTNLYIRVTYLVA